MEKTNIEQLLSSQEFTAQVNKIANDFAVPYNSSLKDDVKQACALAAFEAYQKYDGEKVGHNFWGYAYLRMREYAKREIHNQRNTIHIPMNRTSEWGDRYERVNNTYETLTWDDGHDKFGEEINAAGLRMDIKAAMYSLDEESRYILEVISELKKSKNGENSVDALSKELGMSAAVIRRKLNNARVMVANYLER